MRHKEVRRRRREKECDDRIRSDMADLKSSGRFNKPRRSKVDT
jgi:hypothetical protein